MLHGWGGSKADFESTSPAGDGNETFDYNNVYYAQQGFAVVNYSDHQSQCRLRLPFAEMAGLKVRLVDMMGSEVYCRDGRELGEPGLFIDQGPWRYNVFRLESGEKRP